MSAPVPPGAASGDRSIYSGRQLLGTVRRSVGGVTAFDSKGQRIGSFASEKAAREAVHGKDGRRGP